MKRQASIGSSGRISGYCYLALIFIAVFLLSSCTVVHYQIGKKFEGPPQKHSGPCDIKYSLDITSGSFTNTFGVRKSEEGVLQEIRGKYIESTNEVFNTMGCAVTHVKTEGEANFKVRVDRLIHRSALPQEWLTGLSLGLIPSWGTRPSEHIYAFEDMKTKQKHEYFIDTKAYNHLMLFPVFWINFIMLDEFGVYEEALTNFITSS